MDSIKDLLIRYRTQKLQIRFLIMFFLGLLPAAYVYYLEADETAATLQAAAEEETVAAQKLAKAKRDVKDIDQLEKKLTFTQDQLEKAKASLPESYAIDELLRAIALIAKEDGVEMYLFEPGAEQTVSGVYPYNEIRIKLNLVGRYNEIAAYIDRVISQTGRAYLKAMTIKRHSGEEGKSKEESPVAAADANTQKFDAARNARQNQRLIAEFSLALHRSVAAAAAPPPVPATPPAAAPAPDGKKPPDTKPGDQPT